MITTAQATQYLDQMLGVGAPGFLVDAAIDDVAGYEASLTAARSSNWPSPPLPTEGASHHERT